MAKRKADRLSEVQSSESSSSKKLKANVPVSAADKRSNLLDDSDSGISSDPESDGGVKVEKPDFTINQEYAKRFEHNKKREELQRLEEKFANDTRKAKGQYGDKYDEDSESSDGEDEDDEGILATEELDAQISDALNAIRSKDPRVYNTEAQFYTPIEENGGNDEATKVAEPKKQKPMYLTDYHRENLLKGHTGADEEDEVAPRTFVQEQDDLKKTIVKEMHAAAEDGSDSEADEDGGFLIPKSKPAAPVQGAMHPSRLAKVKVDLDISLADKNPETFLSNFMASRAWVPSDGARFQPLESDDEEEDDRAESFEQAYNLRFEDAKGSNEVLKSYARDVIAAKSVRREEPSGRKKQRDTLREKIEANKKDREEERAQLRRLKIEEAEEKLKKIKRAAGLRGKTLNGEEWADFLDDGWDDKKWESEMSKRFGEDYYAEVEVKSDSDDEDQAKASKKKVKKPQWDDDIDIGDLVPEFEGEDSKKPEFMLSDSEPSDDEDDAAPKKKTSKDRQQEKQSKKKLARLERKQLEDLVDSKMDLDLPSKSKQSTVFRYRETSPTSFGLTAFDILMAPDASLNEFAGLKKMATFRDAEKKRKDKKKLGKKARLRQWRKETFGNEDGPDIALNTEEPQVNGGDELDIVDGGRKKKKRSRKSKGISQPK